MYSFKFHSALLYTIILMAFSVWITGCKKKKSDEPHYTLEPNGLSYIQLPLGRYFIYKDSVTLKLDSVVVTESNLETLHATDQSVLGQFYYQKYMLKLTKIDIVNSRWLSGEATTLFSSTEFLMIANGATTFYEGYLFRYPISAFNQGSGGLKDSVLATMSVEGKNYNEVIRITQSNSNGSIYYWAKGVGIIKYIKGGNTFTTYTLVRNG